MIYHKKIVNQKESSHQCLYTSCHTYRSRVAISKLLVTRRDYEKRCSGISDTFISSSRDHEV